MIRPLKHPADALREEREEIIRQMQDAGYTLVKSSWHSILRFWTYTFTNAQGEVAYRYQTLPPGSSTEEE